MKKSEKILRRVLVVLFILITVAGIIFTMSVEGPGMPHSSQDRDDITVRCFFPFLDMPEDCAKDVMRQPNQQ